MGQELGLNKTRTFFVTTDYLVSLLGAGKSSEVCLPGGDNISGLSRDDGTVGIADQGSGSVGNGSVDNAGNGVDDTASVEEGSLGSGDSRGVCGNHGTVGVTHKLGGADGHAGRENQELHDVC